MNDDVIWLVESRELLSVRDPVSTPLCAADSEEGARRLAQQFVGELQVGQWLAIVPVAFERVHADMHRRGLRTIFVDRKGQISRSRGPNWTNFLIDEPEGHL